MHLRMKESKVPALWSPDSRREDRKQTTCIRNKQICSVLQGDNVMGSKEACGLRRQEALGQGCGDRWQSGLNTVTTGGGAAGPSWGWRGEGQGQGRAGQLCKAGMPALGRDYSGKAGNGFQRWKQLAESHGEEAAGGHLEQSSLAGIGAWGRVGWTHSGGPSGKLLHYSRVWLLS